MLGKSQTKGVSFLLEIIIRPVLNQKKNLKMTDVFPIYQGQTKIPGPIFTRHCILRTSFLTNLLNAYTQISSLCAQEILGCTPNVIVQWCREWPHLRPLSTPLTRQYKVVIDHEVELECIGRRRLEGVRTLLKQTM